MESIVLTKTAGTHCSCRAAALRRARALVLVLDDLSSCDELHEIPISVALIVLEGVGALLRLELLGVRDV